MSDEEVDLQTATEVKTRLTQCVQERLTTELQQSCETEDRVIKEAWQAILTSLQAVEDRQRIIVGAYKTVLQENIFGIVTKDLTGITLPSYRDIAAHFAESSPKSSLVGTTPTVSLALPSPQVSPALSRPLFLSPGIAATVTDGPRPAPFERSGTLTTDEEEAAMPNNENSPSRRVFKRGGDDSLAARQPPEKRARKKPDDCTAMRTIDAKLVRGQDYIFPFSPLGRDWFVVRCNLGEAGSESVYKFTSHPMTRRGGLDSSPAMRHFKYLKNCTGHKARSYTIPEIILEFGYRVVGDEVNEKWVTESNQKLRSNYAVEPSNPSRGLAREQCG